MNEEEFTRQLLAAYPLMGRWARKYVSSESDIEDIVQNVFLKAFSRRVQYDETRGTIKQWLAPILNNYCIDQYRQRIIRPELVSLEEPEAFTFASEIASEPVQIAYCELMEVSRVVAQQPALRGKAFILSVFDNTSEEVAAILDVPHGTAKSWILRTRKKILQELAFR